MGAKAFTFQSSQTLIMDIMEAIPNDWQTLTGTLFPTSPKKGMDTRKIVFHFTAPDEPAATLELDVRDQKHELVQRIMFTGPPNKGYVDFINQSNLFREAIYTSLKVMITYLLLRDYGGVINFAKTEIGPTDLSTPARCMIAFDFRRTQQIDKSDQPARIIINLAWDENEGGQESDVRAIIDVCEKYEKK